MNSPKWKLRKQFQKKEKTIPFTVYNGILFSHKKGMKLGHL